VSPEPQSHCDVYQTTSYEKVKYKNSASSDLFQQLSTRSLLLSVAHTLTIAMLHAIVLTLGRLNECLACFNPWIFVPPRGLDRRTSWLHPLSLSLSYAVIEPIAVLAIQASAIPPWVLALYIPPFGAWVAFISIAWQDPDYPDNFASTKDKEGTLGHSKQHQTKSVLAMLPCVLTTAVINAAYLLFGQSLYASWIQERYYITHILGPMAVVINLLCRYPDYEIYKRTGRPLALRELRCGSVYGPALLCLAVLFSARLCVRTMVGVEPFLAFKVLGSVEANAMYPEPV
jgi:hypothetical protein